MINPKKTFDIYDYIEIFYRRIWYIIIPLVIIFPIAIIHAFNAPKMYRSTTLILVTPQKIPEAFVRTTVTSRIEDRLQSISQEIMSRTHLEQLITEYNLYSEIIKKDNMEEVVGIMRNNIKLDIRGREGYFRISFINKDPKMTAMVTNKLASLFIEGNLKLREQQAKSTSEFINMEMQAVKINMEEIENKITMFKTQYINELPEQLQANLRVLEQLQLQNQRIADSLRAAKERKLFLQKQISDLRMQSTSSDATDNITQSLLDPQTQSESRLMQLFAMLENLKLKYTEKHPDIMMIKKEIENIRKQNQQGASNDSISASNDQDAITGFINKQSGFFSQELKNQLVATNSEIKNLKGQDRKISLKMAGYQNRIENTPIRELGLNALMRDYQNISRAYQSLLEKNQAAKQAENLEIRQKGEQFRVIDPARIPLRPFKPSIPKIILFGLLFGIGSGGGLAFLREQMDRSFRDAEDVNNTLGLKVLISIPGIDAEQA